MIRAVSNPYVDIIGHPTGRLLADARPVPARPVRGDRRGGRARRRDRDQRPPAAPRPRPGGPASRPGPRDEDERSTPTRTRPAGSSDVAYGIDTARRGWCTAERRAQHAAASRSFRRGCASAARTGGRMRPSRTRRARARIVAAAETALPRRGVRARRTRARSSCSSRPSSPPSAPISASTLVTPALFAQVQDRAGLRRAPSPPSSRRSSTPPAFSGTRRRRSSARRARSSSDHGGRSPTRWTTS